MNVYCIILAAGASRRFGSDKLVYRLEDGGTLLDRALGACAAYPTVVVCSSSLAQRLQQHRVDVAINDVPELGMSESLRRANERIDPANAIVVLPADVALIHAEHVARVIDASAGVDVTYPARADGTPGHPVVFSPRAREGIAQLPQGDTIRHLRDRDDLTRRVLHIEEPWPYQDVDVTTDLRAIARE